MLEQCDTGRDVEINSTTLTVWLTLIEKMKLKDCDCGGIPHVTYDMDDDLEFTVVCEACGNQTPACENLREGVSLWNLIYFRALRSVEMEPA